MEEDERKRKAREQYAARKVAKMLADMLPGNDDEREGDNQQNPNQEQGGRDQHAANEGNRHRRIQEEVQEQEGEEVQEVQEVQEEQEGDEEQEVQDARSATRARTAA